METVYNTAYYLKRMETVVKILNSDINFMFPIKYNQNTIDGIIYVLETFRICKGVKQNVENPQENSPNHAKWTSLINQTMNETRERLKVSNSIMSINSQLNICFACSSQVRLRRKRKLDNTLPDQKKNPSNKLVINKNILNVELKDTNKSLQKKIETKTNNEERIKSIHVPEINLQNKEQEHEEHQKECVNLSEEDNIDMQNILDYILKKGAPDDFRPSCLIQ